MLKLKSLCLLIVVLILSGCSTSTKGYVRPTLPANLSEPCPPIPELDTDSWDELGKAHIELAILYGECAAKHRVLMR
ncbi:Rz1-like lysis system protein LysC [Paenalcaligenes suwonensis]|uniref:Rz1-like lysis system protein LysC n=1 Tax=Paenalcaligenes suwonensis TaxID=1202713 RepID=UPI003BF9944A